MAFTVEVQTGPNGPWTPEFRARVERAKDQLGYSLADVGDAFGFSGSFIHGLMNGKSGYKMASKHATRVLQALEGLEVQAGIRKAAPKAAVSTPALTTSTGGRPDLAQLVRQIYELGFTVELKPRSIA
ncbi:hypothetical protein [Sphingomonas sp.]|uniref:hypothetical protein n=1 Tax=Sphingomonas sp. TaxID=28214 RepID=UPI00389F9C27